MASHTVFGFTASEGHFSISMPGNPTLNQVKHKTFIGTVIENTYTLKTKTEEYTASYTILPGVATVFQSRQTLLRKTKEGFLKDTKATELKTEGEDLVFQVSQVIGKARFYLIDKTIYVITANTTKPERTKIIDQFLNSFQHL